MHQIFRFRLAMLPGLALLAQVASGHAAQSLTDALKQEDAKYLDVPDFGGKDNAPKIEAGSGEDVTPKPQQISQGQVRVEIDYSESRVDGEIERAPVVTIFAADQEVAKLKGESIGFADPPVSVQIAEIDPSNSQPEVVVSFYTGGAHCCSATSVVTASPDGSAWKVVDVGEFDGSPILATDLNGDGRYEIATRDNAFLYAFGCYACSETPLEILTVENGTVRNISKDESFRPAHASWLKAMIANAPEEDVNGFLAGYVGEKTLLGEGKSAWDLMLRYYDKGSDWGA